MESDSPPIGFAFGIRLKSQEETHSIPYVVQTEYRGLPREMVFFIVRAWLKTEEEKYRGEFLKEPF